MAHGGEISYCNFGHAAMHFALENLALSPQCSFASHRRGSAPSFEQQDAKLWLVIETARKVWGAP